MFYPSAHSRFPIISNGDASVTAEMVGALIQEVLGESSRRRKRRILASFATQKWENQQSTCTNHSHFYSLRSQKRLYESKNSASELIGRNIRRKIHMRRWISTKKAVLKLQTFHRMMVERHAFVEFLRSSHRMLATLLMLMQRARYRLMKRSINKIKPWFRLKMQRLKYIHLKMQVHSICHLVRGAFIGNRSRAVILHLIKIQRVAKRWMEYMRYKRLRVACAINIARVFRGWLCRQYNNSAVAHLASSQRFRIVTRLAIKLQSLWRSLSVRLRGMYIVESVLYLQRWARARKERRDYLDKLFIIRWLQTTARKCIAQNRVRINEHKIND